jgi:hypothetical protein
MAGVAGKNRLEWSMAKGDLCREVQQLGFPVEFGDLLAKELGSPRAISRMSSYLRSTKPHSVEMIVDEMLAISAEVKAWQEKKESEEALASYNAYLFERRTNKEDDVQ